MNRNKLINYRQQTYKYRQKLDGCQKGGGEGWEKQKGIKQKGIVCLKLI